MKHYLKFTENRKYVFKAIRFSKSKYSLCRLNMVLSYTRLREHLLEALENVGIDSSSFGLHSLRIGKATAAAENNVSERLIKIHGGWKTDYAETIISKIQ